MMQPPRQMAAMLAEIEVPAFFRAHRGDEVEALGVGDDLRGVERVVDFLDELRSSSSSISGFGSFEDLAGGDALVLHRGQDARFDGGVDGGDDDGVFDRVHERPLAGAFLAGGVEDEIDERLAGFRILLFEDLAR